MATYRETLELSVRGLDQLREIDRLVNNVNGNLAEITGRRFRAPLTLDQPRNARTGRFMRDPNRERRLEGARAERELVSESRRLNGVETRGLRIQRERLQTLAGQVSLQARQNRIVNQTNNALDLYQRKQREFVRRGGGASLLAGAPGPQRAQSQAQGRDQVRRIAEIEDQIKSATQASDRFRASVSGLREDIRRLQNLPEGGQEAQRLIERDRAIAAGIRRQLASSPPGTTTLSARRNARLEQRAEQIEERANSRRIVANAIGDEIQRNSEVVREQERALQSLSGEIQSLVRDFRAIVENQNELNAVRAVPRKAFESGRKLQERIDDLVGNPAFGIDRQPEVSQAQARDLQKARRTIENAIAAGNRGDAALAEQELAAAKARVSRVERDIVRQRRRQSAVGRFQDIQGRLEKAAEKASLLGTPDRQVDRLLRRATQELEQGLVQAATNNLKQAERRLARKPNPLKGYPATPLKDAALYPESAIAQENERRERLRQARQERTQTRRERLEEFRAEQREGRRIGRLNATPLSAAVNIPGSAAYRRKELEQARQQRARDRRERLQDFRAERRRARAEEREGLRLGRQNATPIGAEQDRLLRESKTEQLRKDLESYTQRAQGVSGNTRQEIERLLGEFSDSLNKSYLRLASDIGTRIKKDLKAAEDQAKGTGSTKSASDPRAALSALKANAQKGERGLRRLVDLPEFQGQDQAIKAAAANLVGAYSNFLFTIDNTFGKSAEEIERQLPALRQKYQEFQALTGNLKDFAFPPKPPGGGKGGGGGGGGGNVPPINQFNLAERRAKQFRDFESVSKTAGRNLLSEKLREQILEDINRLKQTSVKISQDELKVLKTAADVDQSRLKTYQGQVRRRDQLRAQLEGDDLSSRLGNFARSFRKGRRAGRLTGGRFGGLRAGALAAAGTPLGENLALGAGFPLLFGGGPGSILGGLAGSLIGKGFGGQILGGAIGQIFDDLIASTAELNKAFRDVTGTLGPLYETGLFIDPQIEKRYREARSAGDYAEAGRVAREPLAQIGDFGGGALRLVGAWMEQLRAAWDGVYKTVGLTVGLLSVPFVAGLTLILRAVQLVFAGFNGIFGTVEMLAKLIPGLGNGIERFVSYLEAISGVRQQRIAEIQKEVASAKKLNDELEVTSRLRAGGAGLTGADKTRFDARVEALERQKELEREIREIQRDSNVGNSPEEAAEVAKRVAERQREFALEEGRIRAEVNARLAREQLDQDRQRADIVLSAYREQFALARRVYDLDIARIDQARQEADYERAVVDYRLRLEDQIAAKRAETARKELQVAQLTAQVKAAEVGLAGDARAFAAGPGFEQDVIRAQTTYLQKKITAEAESLANQIETELQIDALRRAARNEERQLEADRIQMERQRDAVIRSRVQLERQVEDYKMDAADYQRKIARQIADDMLIVAANLNAAFAAGATGLAGMGGGVTGATGLVQGNTGRSRGPHFHIGKADRAPISEAEARALLDPAIRAMVQTTDIYGTRGGAHRGVDLAGPPGTPLNLAPGYRITRIARNNGTAGNTAWVLGPNGTLYEVMHLQDIPAGWEARLAAPPSAGGAAGASPMWGYLRRLMDLETDSNPRPNYSIPGDPVRGALQFKTTTALDAQRRLQIPAGSLQSNSPNVVFPAASEFIRKQYPEAYAAIQNGAFDLADRLLNRVWTSLPGGAEARPEAIQQRARAFLSGAQRGTPGSTGVAAPLLALPPPADIPRPAWAGQPSAVPSDAATTAAVREETEKQVTAAQKLLGLRNKLLELGKQEAFQALLQVAQGENLVPQKEKELKLEEAKLRAINAGSDADNQRAEQSLTQAVELNDRLEATQRLSTDIWHNNKLTVEERVLMIKALQDGIDRLKEMQKLEQGILDTNIRQRIEREAANNVRRFNITGVAESKGLYGAGAPEFNKFKQLGATDEQALQQAELARLTSYKEKIAELQNSLNELSDPMVMLTKGAEAFGSAFRTAFTEILSGSSSAQEALSRMFQSIANAFLDMAAQMLAQKAILGILGLFSGGLSGGGGTGFTESGGLFNTVFGYADGGNPPVGKASLVGEEGPELFIPQEAGTIIPADDTARMLQRYRPGQGRRLVRSNDPEGGGEGGGGTAVIQYTGQVLRFNSKDYVQKDDVPAIISQAARRGAEAGYAKVGRDMRNSRATRKGWGV